MSKIGNLRSGGYGGGNSHTYDGKVKPKRTLADVRKARELAQKKARKYSLVRVSEYKPTQEAEVISQEQLKAQAQRRSAQAAEKAARKASKKGMVTVFNPLDKNGPYVSATPEQARLIEAANKNLATPNLPAVVPKPQYNIGEILNGGNKFKLNNPFASSSSNTLAVLGNGTSVGAAGAAGAGGIGARAGAGAAAGTPNLPAIIENRSTESRVISQTVNGETKKPGFWSKLKGGISGLFGKAKNAIKTGWSKFKAFAKTPKGKVGIAIAVVIVAGTALLGYVADRFSDKNNPKPTNGPDKINMPKVNDPNKVDDEETDDVDDVEETKSTKKNEEDDDVDDEDVDEVDESNKTDKTDKAEKTDKNDKSDTTKAPVTDSEKEEADKVAHASKDKREPAKVSGNEYEVVEGDCVWNIAKAHLKELNKDKADYVPTNVEILRHTKELMKINDLHYEADNYVVIIQPGQKIKFK